jgi:hypothetical protein
MVERDAPPVGFQLMDHRLACASQSSPLVQENKCRLACATFCESDRCAAGFDGTVRHRRPVRYRCVDSKFAGRSAESRLCKRRRHAVCRMSYSPHQGNRGNRI